MALPAPWSSMMRTCAARWERPVLSPAMPARSSARSRVCTRRVNGHNIQNV